MKLRIGEKVRFLNEAIEGMVTRILSNERVEVTDVHGFTHTAPEKYLVREEFVPGNSLVEDKEETVVEVGEKSALISKRTIAGVIDLLKPDETIYASIRALVPAEPFSSDVELRLVNNCNHSICFTANKKMDALQQGITAGVLKPHSEALVGVYSPDEIQQTLHGFTFQLLIFDEQPYKHRPAVEKTIHFNSSDFVESAHWHSIENSPWVLVMPLFLLRGEQEADVEKLLAKYDKEVKEKSTLAKKQAMKKGRKMMLSAKEKVVDLHIEELLKDYSGMTNAQIIAYQIKHFDHEMDQAVINHVGKITFIHGVGEGVLRSAIREELKKYHNVEYGDAPYERFGFGATEVIFK